MRYRLFSILALTLALSFGVDRMAIAADEGDQGSDSQTMQQDQQSGDDAQGDQQNSQDAQDQDQQQQDPQQQDQDQQDQQHQ